MQSNGINYGTYSWLIPNTQYKHRMDKSLDNKFKAIAMDSINVIRIERGCMMIKCDDII